MRCFKKIKLFVITFFRPQLNNLQPVQLTELETEFSKVEGQKAIPQRFIRSEQRKQIIPVIAAEEVDGGK